MKWLLVLFATFATLSVSPVKSFAAVRPTTFSGEPTERSRNLPHRRILQETPVYDVDGNPSTAPGASTIVVLLRSLG